MAAIIWICVSGMEKMVTEMLNIIFFTNSAINHHDVLALYGSTNASVDLRKTNQKRRDGNHQIMQISRENVPTHQTQIEAIATIFIWETVSDPASKCG